MPRRRVIPILFFAWLGNAFALEPFDERVQLAKAAESDEQLKAYLPAMYGSVGPQLASMLRNCIDRTDGADKSPFLMIADISSTGAAQGAHVPDRGAGTLDEAGDLARKGAQVIHAAYWGSARGLSSLGPARMLRA